MVTVLCKEVSRKVRRMSRGERYRVQTKYAALVVFLGKRSSIHVTKER